MEEIIQMAVKLGKAISDSPQAQAMKQARLALNQHKDVLDLLKSYQEQADKIARLEEQSKPVEVEDKHKLRSLHEKLVASDVFKRFTAAQVEYIDLMRRVNAAMHKSLADAEPPAGGAQPNQKGTT